MREAVISSGEVNRYGYRIVPEGIRLEAYERNPVLLVSHDGRVLSIGKMTLRLHEGVLKGIPEFDEGDELAQECKRKYEKGYLNAFSIDHQPITLTDDPETIKPGQTRMTVMETDLLEISIVNVPGDRGAVALSHTHQNIDHLIPKLQLQLNHQSQTQIPREMSFEKISKALGLQANATEDNILDAITKLSSRVTTAENARVESLIASGKDAGVINDENEDAIRKLSALDYENAEKLVRIGIKKATDEGKEASGKQLSAKDLIDTVKQTIKSVKAEDDDETFEKLSKENPKKLNEIRKTDPARYAKLAGGYAATNN